MGLDDANYHNVFCKRIGKTHRMNWPFENIYTLSFIKEINKAKLKNDSFTCCKKLIYYMYTQLSLGFQNRKTVSAFTFSFKSSAFNDFYRVRVLDATSKTKSDETKVSKIEGQFQNAIVVWLQSVILVANLFSNIDLVL